MKKSLSLVVLFLSGVRLTPHIIIMMLSPNRSIINADIARWGQLIYGKQSSNLNQRIAMLVRLLTFSPAYRNLFYYRTGIPGRLIRILCRPIPSLYIVTKKIGPGLFIQHGFSTIIAAAEIGENCWINQQVTIGYSNATDCPTLRSNVRIYAGAKVIGGVTIGENSIVGANAVVVKNVPSNVTVVGVPAYIVKKDGLRVHLSL